MELCDTGRQVSAGSVAHVIAEQVLMKEMHPFGDTDYSYNQTTTSKNYIVYRTKTLVVQQSHHIINKLGRSKGIILFFVEVPPIGREKMCDRKP